MNYEQYLAEIISFNSDKRVVALREKFNKASFFEIISKERSETTYSAFLRWLFSDNGSDDGTCSPLAFLLDILVRRSEEQRPVVATILKNLDVKKSIVTRQLSLDAVKVDTEVPVSVLAQAIVNGGILVEGVLPKDQLQKIAAKSQDRIDLFIECDIRAADLKARKLQIIIENKIDSSEGGKKVNKTTGVPAYDEASQTTRYYLGSRFCSVEFGVGKKELKDGLETIQLYVYLTPEAPHANAGIDNHFIQINYQDLVDGVIMPMLASSNLSSRRRFFLEEFLNQLVYPSLNGKIMRPSIAIGKEHSEELSNVWKRYQTLLTDAAIAAAESNLWKVGDTYYDHQPRTEVLSQLLEKGVQDPDIVDGQWKQGIWYKKIQEIAKRNGIETDSVSLDVKDECKDLLASFWDKNRRLLTAIINGMNLKDRQKVEALLQEVAKRDTTKYNVYYQDRRLNGEPLGKAGTVLCIIKQWALLQKKVTLQILRDTFPLSYNPYYATGQWYKYLFYAKDNCTYDGPKGDGSVPTSKWDIDASRYMIDTEDGPVIFLKMWRKDGLEHFIEEVQKAGLFPEGSLNVVPVNE